MLRPLNLVLRRSLSSTTRVSYETIKVTRENKLGRLTFNRPEKYNAVNTEMYWEIIDGLKELKDDDNVTVVALTGEGKFYSSGNDLNAFSKGMSSGKSPEEILQDSNDMMIQFVDAFIEFDKPLVALVNGPAIGIAATSLGLCDLVIAAESAWFQTPFTKLGQTAEGCSSYTFPQIMGPSLASEFLMFNKKFSAQEAHRAGLVGYVHSDADFNKLAWDKVNELSELPPGSLRESKQLIRNKDIVDKLKSVNRQEGQVLMGRWASEECLNAIMEFMMRKRE